MAETTNDEKIIENQDKLDKQLAKRLIEDADLWEFLERKMLLPQEQLSAEQVANMTNSDLGELVKADVLAQEKVKIRFAAIKTLASHRPPGRSIVAPR